MFLLKQTIYLCLLAALVTSCDDSPPSVTEPTSTLKPEQSQEITEQKVLAKQMFTSALTRIENGTISALILREGDNMKLVINDSKQTLSELCKTQEACMGGVYVSVHNNGDKGELFHRIHKGNTLQMACVWLESFPSKFGSMDDTLQQEVIGRAWHWVKVCFEQ